GTREFAKVRSGTAVPSPQWQQMRRWWDATITGTVSERNATPLSIRSSLAQLHWRDSCQHAVIVYGTLFGITVLALNLTMNQSFGSTLLQYLDGFLQITVTFSVIAAVLSGIQIGEGICVSGRTEMKRYLAAAPLSDHDFSQTMFWNLFKTMISIFLMIQFGLILSLVIILFLEGPSALNAGLADAVILILKYAVYLLCGFWIINTNLVSVFWTGRTWFIHGLIGGILGLFGLFIGVLSYLELTYRHRVGSSAYFVYMYFLIFVFLTASLLILGGTALAYVAACQKKLIRVSTCIIAGVLWVIGFSLAYYFLYSPPTRPNDVAGLSAFLFFVSLCTLFLTPFATIPLALSWNRHR
ncbi:MAG: hypothetical protein QM501_03680, partial [Gimesia sp.]